MRISVSFPKEEGNLASWRGRSGTGDPRPPSLDLIFFPLSFPPFQISGNKEADTELIPWLLIFLLEHFL